LIIGDLFHSKPDQASIDRFSMVAQRTSTTLILGNHDRKTDAKKLPNVQCTNELVIHEIRFVHEPPEQIIDSYSISGHIHPGIQLKAGMDRLTLPCFWIQDNKSLVLPSFGRNTGLWKIKPGKRCRTFPISGEDVFAWR
jgi:metallophosphoesterase superfamily enzyme